MSTEDRLAALEESLQLVIQGVRALNEHRLVLQESFRLMAEQMERLVEHQAETDEVVNRILRHLMTQSENGNQQ
jgi:hypothetical protein